jgi:hypothetical protein
MFLPDGHRLAFASNSNGKVRHFSITDGIVGKSAPAFSVLKSRGL